MKRKFVRRHAHHEEMMTYVPLVFDGSSIISACIYIDELKMTDKSGVKYAVALCICTPDFHTCMKLAGEILYGKLIVRTEHMNSR